MLPAPATLSSFGIRPVTTYMPWGAYYHAGRQLDPPLPLPRLNHAQSLVSGEAVFVCPGSNLNEYGTNAPQNGTTYTGKSYTLLTFGLPNECASSSTANSEYWRSLRQPAWPLPSLNALFSIPSNIFLTWNACTDPLPADNTQGYLILRNPVNVFTHPNDGQTYVAGENIGGAIVVAVIPSSQTLSYTDTYPLTCGESVYYRVYAFRYGTDNLNGNNYNAARGRAYNETDFGTAGVTIPEAPAIISVVAVDASCGNNNGNISITASGGTFTGPGTVIFSDPAAWNAKVTVSASGVYILRWTISNGTVCPSSEDDVALDFGDAIQVIARTDLPPPCGTCDHFTVYHR